MASDPPTGNEETGLEVKSIVKRFGAFTAVDDVSFKVKRGELVALLGPSGCGKTTILRMLGGLDFPDSGAIVISGRNIEHLPAYERDIGFVFQRYALFPHMTVAANVAYPLRKRGIAKRERQERTNAALELVGLSGFADRNPATMSGGQQQRVALARAIVFEPQVLLLDEPLGALDKQLRDRMQFEVRRIQRALGITTIFVTHDQIEAMAISDRIAVMQGGRIEQIGTALELYDAPATEFVAGFIGDSNLLECDVQETAAGPVARLSNGNAFRIRPSAITGSAKLLLRPERIKIVADTVEVKADNIVRARITDVVYLGESTQCVVDMSGVRLVIRSANDGGRVLAATGDHVQLCWQASDCVVLPGTKASSRHHTGAVTGTRS